MRRRDVNMDGSRDLVRDFESLVAPGSVRVPPGLTRLTGVAWTIPKPAVDFRISGRRVFFVLKRRISRFSPM